MRKLPPYKDILVYVFHDKMPTLLGAALVRLGSYEVKEINLAINAPQINLPNGDPRFAASPLDLLTLATKLLLLIQNGSVQKMQETTIQKLKRIAKKTFDDKNTVSKNERPEKYLIKIKGGGGYYTHLELKLSFSSVPLKIVGSGYSDSNDNGTRVAISKSPSNYFDFRDRGEVDLTRFAANEIYIQLDSKWGTEQDSYMELKVTVPKGCVINYSIVKNPEGLAYCKIFKLK